jgi:hypothetical protein
MANNFRSDFDGFKPNELHLRKKLISRETKETAGSRDIEVATFDISADFLNLGFSCVGLTLTLDNTGIHRNGTPGRMKNKQAAEALKKELYALIKKTLSTIPLWVAWVYERHRNGSPHIHAMLFCPVRDLARVIETCKNLYDDKAVAIKVLSPEYIFKEDKMAYEWELVEKEADFPAAYCSQLLARTSVEIDRTKNKLVRRNVAAVKDVQRTKELYSCCNAKLKKKYPSAELALGNLFYELWRYWKYSHCRTKAERVADNTDKYDTLILGKKSETEPDLSTFQVDKFVLVQPNLGCFGRDVSCKLKTEAADELQQLDLTLWCRDNVERYHVNLKQVYLSPRQIKNLKLWGKKCKNKNDLVTLCRTLFSGKKICGRDPLRMLDFVPKDLSDYDCELLQNRFDIRSWLAFAFPLIRAQKQDDTSDFDVIAFLATCGLNEFFRPIPEPAPPERCCV